MLYLELASLGVLCLSFVAMVVGVYRRENRQLSESQARLLRRIVTVSAYTFWLAALVWLCSFLLRNLR